MGSPDLQFNSKESVAMETSCLTPKGPRIHGFKMTNLLDHIVKNII